MSQQNYPGVIDTNPAITLSAFLKQLQTITGWIGGIGLAAFFWISTSVVDSVGATEIQVAWIGLFGLVMCIVCGMAITTGLIRGKYGRAIESMEIEAFEAQRQRAGYVQGMYTPQANKHNDAIDAMAHALAANQHGAGKNIAGGGYPQWAMKDGLTPPTAK